MKFVGLTPEVFWALLGAMAAILTLLYLLKLRRRRVTVPFSPIWGRVLASKEATSWLERLKRLISLLLQLAIAGLLLLALADPRPVEEDLVGKNVVLLLDTSASMGAIDVSGGVDRLDIARQEAAKVLDGLGPNDSVMLVTMDGQLKPLTPFVKDSAILRQQLKELKPSASPANIQQALRFVRDAVREKPDAELYLMSDGAFAEEFGQAAQVLPDKLKFRHVKTGESGENLAITSFNVRRYLANKQDYEIYVQVRSYFPREVDAELQLSADGALADVKPLKLAAGGSQLLFFPDQGFSGKQLQARVVLKTADAKDVFPMDDAAYAVLPRARKATVAFVSDGNLFLLAPLILNENLDVKEVKPADWTPALAEGVDLIVFDRFTPPTLPEKGAFLFVAPEGEGSPWKVGGDLAAPTITTTKKKHPLLRWVTLQDAALGLARKLQPTAKDDVAASAGNDPLILSREEGERRMVALAFDVRASDLPLRVAMPVLMLNSLTWLLDNEDSLVPTYKTGTAWSIPIGRKVDTATLTTPKGRKVQIPIYEGKAIFYGDEVGFHTVQTADDEFQLAANLADPKESAILPPAELSISGREIPKVAAALQLARRDYWVYLVLAVMALLLFEWLSYHRRWTV
jgi:hypothetical protein